MEEPASRWPLATASAGPVRTNSPSRLGAPMASSPIARDLDRYRPDRTLAQCCHFVFARGLRFEPNMSTMRSTCDVFRFRRKGRYLDASGPVSREPSRPESWRSCRAKSPPWTINIDQLSTIFPGKCAWKHSRDAAGRCRPVSRLAPSRLLTGPVVLLRLPRAAWDPREGTGRRQTANRIAPGRANPGLRPPVPAAVRCRTSQNRCSRSPRTGPEEPGQPLSRPGDGRRPATPELDDIAPTRPHPLPTCLLARYYAPWNGCGSRFHGSRIRGSAFFAPWSRP